MNYFALLAGITIAAWIIRAFKRNKYELARLPYPLLMATFPLYYYLFAMYAGDGGALLKEIGISLLFFLLAYRAIQSRSKLALLLVALGCIFHAAYDALHDAIFINPGTPTWWLEFCGTIDLILGVYLLSAAVRIPDTLPRKSVRTEQG